MLGQHRAGSSGCSGPGPGRRGAFAAVHQAFVAWLGPRRGWLVSIAFAVLQAVSWGVFPVDTAAGLLLWGGAALAVTTVAAR